MLLTVAHIGPKPNAKSPYEPLIRLYLERLQPYHPTQTEAFRSEADFLAWLTNQRKRLPPFPILLDSRGKPLSSPQLAQWLGNRRDQGTQHLVFTIGPPDGWSDPTRTLIQSQAKSGQALLLSFGPITLPHELARLVLAEQLYRACTILQGHPYHSGHE